MNGTGVNCCTRGPWFACVACSSACTTERPEMLHRNMFWHSWRSIIALVRSHILEI